jgi:hypothetical protein
MFKVYLHFVNLFITSHTKLWNKAQRYKISLPSHVHNDGNLCSSSSSMFVGQLMVLGGGSW